MIRTSFIQGALAMAASSLPSPQRTPSAGNSWNEWDRSPALPYDRPIEIEMDLLDAGKEQFVLSHYRGSAVVVNIFATWCGPCRKEQPDFSAIARRYARSGLVVIGMNYMEPDDTVRRYRRWQNIAYPIAMDRDGLFTRALERGKSNAEILFPVSLFFTPGGFVYGQCTGSLEQGELEYRVKRFLNDVSPELTAPSPSPSQSPAPPRQRA